jgi:hypothetical protein
MICPCLIIDSSNLVRFYHRNYDPITYLKAVEYDAIIVKDDIAIPYLTAIYEKSNAWRAKYARYPYLHLHDVDESQLKLVTSRDDKRITVELWVDGWRIAKLIKTLSYNQLIYDTYFYTISIDSNFKFIFKNYVDTIYISSGMNRPESRYAWYQFIKLGFIKVK